MKLSDYVQLPREERVAHIDLSTPCELVPSTRWTREKRLEFFDIEDDVADHRIGRINRCHLCENGQHPNHGGRVCHNPLHFYVGTTTDNMNDKTMEARGRGGRARKGVPNPHSDDHRRALQVPRPRQLMRCLVTGEVRDSGHLTRFQRKRGIDTKLREPA